VFTPLSGVLAWAYFRRDISPLGPSTDGDGLAQARTAQRRIAQLLDSDPYSIYSALPLSTLKVARALVDRNPGQALELLGSLDPQLLSRDGGEYRSHYSQWFTLRAKALANASKWGTLLEFTENAEVDPELSDADLQSIRWHRVRGLEGAGRVQEAIDLLSPLRLARSQWYFDACHARLLEMLGSPDSAIDTARAVMRHSGDLSARWQTCKQLGRLLKNTNPECSADYLLLAQDLRKQKGWKVDPEIETELSSVGHSESIDMKAARARLRADWESGIDVNRSSGAVKALLDGGGSGFIADDDGSDLYFAMGGGLSAPEVGTRVSYRITDGFDKKKNQVSRRATDVKIVAAGI